MVVGIIGNKSQQSKGYDIEVGGLIGIAIPEKNGLMPAGQVFTGLYALDSSQVCLLSTSKYSIAFNVIIWHAWRGMASYHVLLTNDYAKAVYKVIALSNLPSQKFYVTISDNKIISLYLKNDSVGPMNVAIQPVNYFETIPVVTPLPENAIEVTVE